MYPFISVYEIKFPTYGLLMMVGVGLAFGLTALLCSNKLVRGQRVDRADTLLTCSIIIFGALVGAVSLRPIMKLPEVIIYWETFSQYPIGEVMGYMFGEIVFYGGLIGGALAAVIFCKFYRIPMLPTMDAIAPAVPLGHAFGRLGCLNAGCCYGMEVSHDHIFAIVYPEVSLAAPPGVPLIALPALEAGGLFLISIIVVTVFITTKPKGLCLALYLALYSALRFSLEFFRGDLIRGMYGPFSTSQYISMGVFVVSIVLICVMIRRRKAEVIEES